MKHEIPFLRTFTINVAFALLIGIPFQSQGQNTLFGLIKENAIIYEDLSIFQMGRLNETNVLSDRLREEFTTSSYEIARISCRWRDYIRIETGSEDNYQAYLVKSMDVVNISESEQSLRLTGFNVERYSSYLEYIPECMETIAEPMGPIPEEKLTIHIVQRKETLWEISRKYGMDVPTLKDLNNLSSNTIYIGQQLNVSPITRSMGQFNSTEPVDDFIFSTGDPSVLDNGVKLAGRADDPSVYNLPTVLANLDAMDTTINVGDIDILNIGRVEGGAQLAPNPSNYSAARWYFLGFPELRDTPSNLARKSFSADVLDQTHVVRKGESLWRIARDYGIRWKDLRDYNGLQTADLSVGQILKIPVRPYPIVTED